MALTLHEAEGLFFSMAHESLGRMFHQEMLQLPSAHTAMCNACFTPTFKVFILSAADLSLDVAVSI